MRSLRQFSFIVILTGFLFIPWTAVAQFTCAQLFSENPQSLPFDLTGTDPEAIPNVNALGFQPTISESIEFGGQRLVLASDPARPFVGEGFRRKGISEAMFARVLKENPWIEEIESLLDFTNAELIHEMMKDGKSLEEAVWLSPAGRLRARFGFTKLVECLPKNGKIQLVVSRP